jgi:hypothetical protein
LKSNRKNSARRRATLRSAIQTPSQGAKTNVQTSPTANPSDFPQTWDEIYKQAVDLKKKGIVGATQVGIRKAKPRFYLRLRA